MLLIDQRGEWCLYQNWLTGASYIVAETGNGYRGLAREDGSYRYADGVSTFGIKDDEALARQLSKAYYGSSAEMHFAEVTRAMSRDQLWRPQGHQPRPWAFERAKVTRWQWRRHADPNS